MSFFFHQEALFLQQLDKLLNESFFGAELSNAARARKNTLVVQGKAFLNSLKELKSITNDPLLLFSILEQATKTLSTPAPSNQQSLFAQVDLLEKLLADNYKSNHFFVFFNTVGHSLEWLVGISGGVMGATFIAAVCAGTTSTFALTAAISLGPVGIFILGAALLITGIIVASISAYRLNIDVRFLRDKQIKEIKTFTETLCPTAALPVHQDENIEEHVSGLENHDEPVRMRM